MTEKDALESLSKQELDAAVAALKSAALRYSGARRSGVKALEMAAFEQLVVATDRYHAAVERRGEELGL